MSNEAKVLGLTWVQGAVFSILGFIVTFSAMFTHHLIFERPAARVESTQGAQMGTTNQGIGIHDRATPGHPGLQQEESKVAASTELLRKNIGEAIRNGGDASTVGAATKDAINRHINTSGAAYREYTDTIADDIRGGAAPQLETASLPRHNTVHDPQKLFDEAENTYWIAEGDGSKVLYVYYDLKCPACAQAHKVLQPYIDSGEIQVRYIPVGALGPDSLHLASLVLAGEKGNDQLARLKTLMKPISSDALPYRSTPAEDLKRSRVEALMNFQALMATKHPATPAFAYLTEAGPQVGVVRSASQLKQVIETISDSNNEDAL